MKSTLSLPYLTCIDHAFIDSEGRIQGRSYHASFLVTGEVEATENVVVDFSNIKKKIKGIVDDKANGFDHKLWVSDFDPNENDSIPWSIDCPYVALNIPENAIKVFDKNKHLSIASAEKVIAAQVQEDLKRHFGHDVKVECFLNTTPLFMHMGGFYATFSYVHGLRDSSAYGCQNIAHGHLSYIQLISNSEGINAPPIKASSDLSLGCSTLCLQIAEDLNGLVFIRGDNVEKETEADVFIRYVSKDRGVMAGRFTRVVGQTPIILVTETTVEHLADYVYKKYKEAMLDRGVTSFVLSEGLSKGSLFQLPEVCGS